MPTATDFVHGVDFTGYPSVSAAQLNQVIDSATPQTDRGLVIVTTDTAGVPDVPNATATTAWQRYIWLRKGASQVTAYVWNSAATSDATYRQWVTISSASIGVGTITNSMIALATINYNKIDASGIPSSIVTGSLPSSWIATESGGAYTGNGAILNTSGFYGDVTGNAGATLIGSLKVTQGKLALQSVAGNVAAGTGQIIDASITKTQLKANSATPTATEYTTGAVDPQTNIIVPTGIITAIPTSANYVPSGTVAPGDVLAVGSTSGGLAQGWVANRRPILTSALDPASSTSLRVPSVAASSITYALTAPQGNSNFGRILKQQKAYDATRTYTSITVNSTTSIVGNTSTEITALKMPYLVVSSSGILRVRLYGTFVKTATAGYVGIGVCYTASGVAIGSTVANASSSQYMSAAASVSQGVLLEYDYSAIFTAGTTYDFHFMVATSAGTTNFNQSMQWTTQDNQAWIEITEYL